MTAPADPSRQPGGDLRSGAEALAGGLPPLLAEALHLAANVQTGLHGRRRPGQGDEFWQYRPAVPGDETRQIDWRRSGRSDQYFVRQNEWQAMQSVQIWADGAPSMAYHSTPDLPEKRARAGLLALALAILLERGGERVGLTDGQTQPRAGRLQLLRMAEALMAPAAVGTDFGVPAATWLLRGAHAVFLSDFFGDPALLAEAVGAAADRGVAGGLLQILDPAEVSFPFTGRSIFESMGGRLRHETREAGGLGARYRDRLAERQERLAAIARGAGWQFHVHLTNTPATAALLWLYGLIGGPRR